MAIRGLDGYRAIAFKCGGKVHLRSRNGKDFNSRYSAIVKALAGLPDETVIDGEVVALDASGRPSFSALQNHASGETPIGVLRLRCADNCRSGRNVGASEATPGTALQPCTVEARGADPGVACVS